MLKDISMASLEIINPFVLILREKWMQVTVEESAVEFIKGDLVIRIAVSSSSQNGEVGMESTIEIQISAKSKQRIAIFSYTPGLREEQKLYFAKLKAVANALNFLLNPRYPQHYISYKE